MLISVKKRFIFICNPKCGSTSVETAFRNFCEIERGGSPDRKHISMEQVLSEYHFLFNSADNSLEGYFKFGVMRDPVDWFCSWYRYRKGNRVANPLPRDMGIRDFWGLDDWVKYKPKSRSKRRQLDMFVDGTGRCLMDKIIPFDRLSSQVQEIAEKLQVKVILGRENSSAVPQQSIDIDEDLREEIAEFYKADYEFIERHCYDPRCSSG